MGFLLDAAKRLAVCFRLNEIGPLLSLLLLSICGWGFVVLASEVVEGDTHALDQALLLALRDPKNLADPIGPGWLEEAARDITGLGGYAVLILVTLGTAAYLLMVQKRGTALLVVAAVAGGALLSSGLKLGFERPRPDLVPHGTRIYTASFPSGHAMLSATVYLTLAALLARVQPRRRIKLFLVAIGVALTLLIGVSRVYLGVHWPSDVLAGWCGGAAWAALCWFIALQLQRRGKVEGAGESAAEG